MYSVAEISNSNKSVNNMMEIKVKKRIYYLDVLRILSIMAVVVIHSTARPVEKLDFIGTQHWWIANCLDGCLRWAIPVFFMISGALILNSVKEETIGQFYKKTFKKLFIPFFIWSILYFLFKNYYIDNSNILEPLAMVGKFFHDFIFDNIYNHLWFMYIILTMYLVAPFLKKLIKVLNKTEILVWIGIWVLLSFIYPEVKLYYFQQTNEALNLSFADIPFFVGFIGYFILGYYLSNYELRRFSKIIIYIGGFVSALAVPLMTYILSVDSAVLNEKFYSHFSITSLLMGMSMFIFFKGVNWDKLLNFRLRKLISSMSTSTYGIYFIHMMIQVAIFNSLTEKVYKEGIIVLGIYVVNFLCVYITSYVAIKIIGLSPKLRRLVAGV